MKRLTSSVVGNTLKVKIIGYSFKYNNEYISVYGEVLMEENKQNAELQNGEVVHKRRKRYSGTHPKKFSEKYKELNPEKYAADVQHILDKGHTPAGMHISIMVQEILDLTRCNANKLFGLEL